MTLGDWVRETTTRVADDGLSGVRESLYELYLGGLRRVTPLTPDGASVYTRDWDLLVVLDGCRVDVLRSVADEYDWLGPVDTHRSPASCSPEWLDATFHDEAHAETVAETVYVTGNPFSDRQLDHSRLRRVDDLWQTAWDEELGTIPPRPLTDRVIETMRADAPDRLVVHYMQPHFPSPPDPVGDGISLQAFDETWHSPLDRLRRGRIDAERVWQSYRANLRYVLDDVELLLSNVNADTVAITADHGEAFGEWGVYAHPCGVPVPTLRRVPWVEVSATDTEEYEPTTTEAETTPTSGVESKLESLGYV
ncbi:hypothetical protein RYH80_06845 [Halobaculum sp. MBLA0147]|uniref:hypothetical protein n=1 Tax=Halobaculum sp. MBLA0147 TaxID=3079934 RepID=UPI003525E4C2